MKLNELQKHFSEFFKNTEIQDSPRVWQDLICFGLNLSWSDLHLKKEMEVAEDKIEQLKSWAQEIKEGKPLAHITNEQFFYKDSFYVDNRVLIPRPETEILVEKGLELLPEGGVFADLGTGSGCIGLSIAKYSKDTKGYLVDASSDALDVCRKNCELLGLDGQVTLEEDHLDSQTHVSQLEKESLDLIVANPPYIAEGDSRVSKSVFEHEPHLALFSDEKGLLHIDEWQKWAFSHLKNGGTYIFEFGKNQEGVIHTLLENSPWANQSTIEDLSGAPRFFILKKS